MTSNFDCDMARCMIMASQNTPESQNVSRETFSLLAEYVNLLLKWNAKINLIGPATEQDIGSRHIEDSLQLVERIPESATSLADLGSGGGLPGIVIAIVKPELAVTLIEHDQRKAAFLKEAKRILGLTNVTVEALHINQIDRQFDVVTARALASLSQLFSYAEPLLTTKDALMIFPKGAHHAAEITEAEHNWQFKYQIFPSKTNSESAVITISQLQPLAQ